MESKVKIDSGDLAVASFLMIAAGIIGGLVAALFGLIDWIAVLAGTRAKRVGAWHGGGNVVVVALALGTAWAGGELVERLGVGVDEGAHLDAPSSLSGPMTGPAGAPWTRRLSRSRSGRAAAIAAGKQPAARTPTMETSRW